MDVLAAGSDRAPGAMKPRLRRTALGFIGALTLVVCAAFSPAQAVARGACAAENAPISTTSPASLRASVLCLVNLTRLEHGLPALHEEDRLELAAQQHSDDMVTNHYFAHDAPDGRTPSGRVSAAGYNWAQTGETIAQGQSTPARVVANWLDEANSISGNGHCVNILGPGFRDLGVGVNPGTANVGLAPGTWTQDFGRLRVDAPASANTGPQAGCPYQLAVVSAGPVPTSSTTAATDVTATSAVLNGAVGANGGGFTSYHVEYGATSGYGAQTLECVAGTSSASVIEPVSGLARATTYHFRVVAMNKNGETDGPDGTFVTVPGSGTGPNPKSSALSRVEPSDVTAPAVALSGSRSQMLGHTVRVGVSCADEALHAQAGGTVLVPRVGTTKAKLYKLEKVTAAVAQGGAAKLGPSLSSAARRAIGGALRRGRRITVRLKVTVADGAGNSRTLSRRVKLRR